MKEKNLFADGHKRKKIMKQTRMQICSVAVIEMFLCVIIFSAQKQEMKRKNNEMKCCILIKSVTTCVTRKKRNIH